MTKYVIVGDTHGDIDFMMSMIEVAATDNAPILQVGDFGFIWDDNTSGLDDISSFADELGVKIFFIPGNHENFDMLESLQTGETFSPIRKNIFYTGKTARWSWSGVNFVVAGGAYSIDKAWRRPGVSWWHQELLTESDVEPLLDDPFKADIMLAHDTPVCPFTYPSVGWEEVQQRRLLGKVMDAYRPTHLFHGHHHKSLNYVIVREDFSTYAHSVASNLEHFEDPKGSYVVLDTDNL